jgi:hypothetical protein
MTSTTTASGPFDDVGTSTHNWSMVSDVTAQNRARTGTAPALIRFRGVLYLFYRGTSDDGTVYYCTSRNGSRWSGRIRLIERPREARAAAEVVPIVFRDVLYAFFRDRADPGVIKVCSTADGQEWSALSTITTEAARSSSRPVPVEYGGSLYVFYRGDSATRGLRICANSTGSGWTAPVDLEHMTGTMADAPVPVVHGDRLVVAFRPGQSPSILLTLVSDDGAGWRYGGTITATSFDTATNPALISYWGMLYAFYTDQVDEGTLLVTQSIDGLTWYGWRSINGHNRSRETPVPAVHDDRLFLFFRDESDPTLINVCTKNDNDSWNRHTSISARNRAAPDGALQVVADEFGIDVAYRATDHDGTGLATFHATAPQPWSARLTDVPAAVAAVSTTGVFKHCVVGDVTQNAYDRIRSIVPYRDWFLLPRHRGLESRGQMDIADRDREREARVVTLPEEGLNHPGGGQVIGDYFALSLEGTARHHGCVRFYDLAALTDTTEPALLDLRVDLGRAANAVGITDVGSGADRHYVLAVYGEGEVSVYESNPVPLGDPRCGFTFRFSCRTSAEPAPDHISLLTDVHGDVWLVGLGSHESAEPTESSPSIDFEDWVTLYKLDLQAHRMAIWSREQVRVQAPERFLIHFRFGAGLEVIDAGAIRLFASDRNVDSVNRSWRLSYNEFGPRA